MLRSLLTLAAVLAAIATPALGASGTALGVDPAASLKDGSGTRTLVVGTDVFIGDRVTTDAGGLVQIRFTDRTELVVGPGSSLVIEDYLLREDGSGGKFAINMLAGTFRFVTGGAAKNSYSLKTPTGTIGVRGTAFDTNVHPDHASLLLYHGAVVMCNNAGQCITVEEFCDVGMFDFSEARLLGNADDFRGTERTSMRGMFPWSVSEAELLGPFRIDGARQCLNRSTAPGDTDSLVEGKDATPRSRQGGSID